MAVPFASLPVQVPAKATPVGLLHHWARAHCASVVQPAVQVFVAVLQFGLPPEHDALEVHSTQAPVPPWAIASHTGFVGSAAAHSAFVWQSRQKPCAVL